MIDWLIHYGALLLFIAIALGGATARAIRDYRRNERGEQVGVVVDDDFMRRG